MLLPLAHGRRADLRRERGARAARLTRRARFFQKSFQLAFDELGIHPLSDRDHALDDQFFKMDGALDTRLELVPHGKQD